MRLLTDENIGLKVVTHLRSLSYDVVSAIEDYQSATDTKILTIAKRQKRILITTDKDFGELVFLRGLVPYGVILLRLREESAKNKIRVLDKLFKDERLKIAKKFAVITESQVRFRPIRTKL